MDTWLAALAALILGREDTFANATSSLIFRHTESFVGVVKNNENYLEATFADESAGKSSPVASACFAA